MLDPKTKTAHVDSPEITQIQQIVITIPWIAILSEVVDLAIHTFV